VSVTFWVVGALFCIAAAAMLLVPVWHDRRRAGRWSPLGLVVAIGVAPAAIGLYALVSDWDFDVAQRASESDRLVAALAERLAGNPDDLQGWRLLANSYMALGRFPEGLEAYRHIWSRTQNPDDELKLAYAEAQILVDGRALMGEAGRLVEEVLSRQPNEPKALWYGGHFALAEGRNEVARSRWTALLAFELPPEVAQRVRTELAALGGPSAAGVSVAAAAPAPAGPVITLNVSVGAGRNVADLGANVQLFIAARAPEGGPPLAVLRQPGSALPGEFTLSDANTMIQGRSLANYPEVTIVARLSPSGQPTAQPGDWEGQAVVSTSDRAPVAIVIDRVVQ
jgi:cytochrome c-type biogenesis protein CcmH